MIDPFGYLAHLAVYGESPSRTLAETKELANALEREGRSSSAAEIRTGLQEGVGVHPRYWKMLRRDGRA